MKVLTNFIILCCLLYLLVSQSFIVIFVVCGLIIMVRVCIEERVHGGVEWFQTKKALFKRCYIRCFHNV
jgi:hypothetical protein